MLLMSFKIYELTLTHSHLQKLEYIFLRNHFVKYYYKVFKIAGHFCMTFSMEK